MTTIWLDPVELRSAAAVLAEQAMRIQETVVGTRENCTCAVPRSLVGWLDDELLAITEDAMRVAVAYLTEAVGVATRADEILANQSLATTSPGLVAADMSVIGGVHFPVGLPHFQVPFGEAPLNPPPPGTPGVGSGQSRALEQMVLGQLTAPSLPNIIDIFDGNADGIRTILSPPGLSFDDGAWVDGGGDRSSSLAGAYEDPVTGELDF